MILWCLALAIIGGGVWWGIYRTASPAVGVREVEQSQVLRKDGLLAFRGESSPFTGLMTGTYANGNKKWKIEVSRGRVHGLTRGWYENGQLECEEIFAADVSHGTRTRWHRNGARKSLASIRTGKIEGIYTEWHDNGQKALAMHMQNGVADGLTEAWHPDGTLKSRVVMDLGKLLKRDFFDNAERSVSGSAAMGFR